MRFAKYILAIALAFNVAFAADSGAVNEDKQVWAGKKIFLDNVPTSTTATGNITLLPDSTRVQLIDPGGSARNVTLPAIATSKGYEFYIVNKADAAESLTVKNAAATTIGTIAQSEAGFFWCDDTAWYGFTFTSAASGFLTADGLTTGGTAQTQILTNGVTLDTIIGNSAAPLTVTGKVGAANTVGNALTMAGGAGGATNATGGAVSLTGGAGAGTGSGGAATLAGGVAAGGATGNGGATSIISGASTATNGTGGAIAVTCGLGTGSGAGGSLTGLGGAGGATGAGGSWTVTAGRGGSTSGNSGAITVTAGAGGASSTATGGAVTLVGGASGGGATGAGGNVALTGGAAGSTNGGGGSNVLTPGAKAGTGIAGGNFLRSATAMHFQQYAAAVDIGDTAPTLTAAQMINGIIFGTPLQARAVTTPTGAAISAGCPVSLAVGDCFEVTFITLGTGGDDVWTLTAGDGDVTFVGAVTIGPVVANTAPGSMTWIFRNTGTGTWVGYRKN
jgi:hypothetical protein